MGPQTPRNALVGFFFLVAIVAFVIISVILSGAQDALVRTSAYTVRFDIGEGATGLSSGAPVNLGGVKVGRVTGVEIDSDERGRPRAIATGVRIRADIVLYDNARFQLKAPLLGAASVIDIVSIGAGGDAADGQGAILQPGGSIDGEIAPPQFLEHAGFGPEQAEQMRQTIAHARDVMARLDRVLEELEPSISDVAGNVRLASADVRATAADVRQRLGGWGDRVDTTLTSAEQTAASLQRTAATLEQEAQAAGELLAQLRQTVDTNRPRIDSILASADASMIEIRDHILPEVRSAADRGRASAEQFAQITGELNTLVREEAPGVRRTLSSARLAADQLKHAAAEIRQSPWRLLQRPTTRELESELIYNAAGLLASAASDLQASSAALRATDQSASDEDVARLVADLADAMAAYREAEAALMRLFAER
ncbi:MAG: MlaD family protein [Phycisphaerales bacterium JB039]